MTMQACGEAQIREAGWCQRVAHDSLRHTTYQWRPFTPDSSEGVWVKLPKELRLSDDWLWYGEGALWHERGEYGISGCGARHVCRVRMDTVADCAVTLLTAAGLDALSVWHGDDFYTEVEPETLDEVDVMILWTFKAEVLPRLGPGVSAEGTILRRILKWSTEGVHLTPDAKHVENLAVSSRSRVQSRVQHLVLVPLVAGSETCWSH